MYKFTLVHAFLLSADFFQFFFENSTESNSLNPDQARPFVGPDLDSIYLLWLLAHYMVTIALKDRYLSGIHLPNLGMKYPQYFVVGPQWQYIR